MTKVKSKTLSLAMPQPASPISSTVTSPSETDSRTASPSRMREAEMYQYRAGNGEIGTRDASPSLEEAKTRKGSAFTSLPSVPHSPQNVPRHGQSRSLFGNLKAAKSSNKVDKLETTIRQVSEDQPRDNVSSGVAGIYSLGKGPGSTPDLSLSTLNTSNMDIPGGRSFEGIHTSDTADVIPCIGQDEPDSARRPVGSSILSDTALLTTSTASSTSRKTKPRFAQLLTRTRSIRTDEGGGRRSKPPTPIQTPVQEDRASIDEGDDHRGLKTAPLDMESNRSFRDLMGSAIRNKSADRQPTNKASTASNLLGRAGGEHRGLNPSSSAVFRDGTGSKLFANIKGTSSKAADGLGKAGKGLFNKMGRSGSSNNRDEAGDAHYTLKVINLPLVEQTRHTRIARRLEDSRDKTEFWMPALPWRCIECVSIL